MGGEGAHVDHRTLASRHHRGQHSSCHAQHGVDVAIHQSLEPGLPIFNLLKAEMEVLENVKNQPEGSTPDIHSSCQHC